MKIRTKKQRQNSTHHWNQHELIEKKNANSKQNNSNKGRKCWYCVHCAVAILELMWFYQCEVEITDSIKHCEQLFKTHINSLLQTMHRMHEPLRSKIQCNCIGQNGECVRTAWQSKRRKMCTLAQWISFPNHIMDSGHWTLNMWPVEVALLTWQT